MDTLTLNFLTLEKALRNNDATLTTLHFRSNEIGNEGAIALADALKENTTLATLDLGYNQIGNEGAIALANVLKENTTLTTLNLYKNQIGNDGAIALAEALKENATLTTLNLGSNEIGNEGAIALANVLKENTTITTLDLLDNQIDNEGAIALADALKENTTLTTLNLGYNQIGNEGAIALADALKENTTLATLDLGSNEIGNEGAIALANVLKENTTLATLNLYKNQIGNDGAIALAEALKENATLTTLNLGYNQIGSEGAIALADALKENTTLTTLDLGSNKIGNEGAIELANVLKENTTLTTLNLYKNQIGNDGAIALAEALKENATLTTLNLGYNQIGSEGAIALADALKENTTLTTLNFGSNEIGNEGAIALADALKENTTLATLDLLSNEIDNEGAIALADALKENTTLTTLNLFKNEIGKEGNIALADALKENTTITTLELENNFIDNEGAHVKSNILDIISRNRVFHRHKDDKQNEHFKKIENRDSRRSKSLRGDHATGKDLLGVLDEANAIAEMISFKDLKLPFVVGIIGGWGSGKSFTYNLIRERLIKIQKYDLTDENFKKKFPYVGHIFLVKFDVWVYAKGNLWSSLMYRILTDLNDQLDLEETITPEFIERGVSVLELMEEFTTSGELKYLAEVVKDGRVLEGIRKWNPKVGNITKALIDATISNYDNEVKDLAEKKQKLDKVNVKKKQRLHEVTVKKKQELAWRDVTAGKITKILPEIQKLLKDAYEQAKKHPDEPFAMDKLERWEGTLGCFKRYWELIQAGKWTPLWFTVFLSSIMIAVVLPLVLDKAGAALTALGPLLSSIFAKFNDAREKLQSAQDVITKVANEMHLDEEVLREALRAANEAQSGSNTNDEENPQEIIQELNAEINSLEHRIWLKKGEPLNKVVKERVGSSNYEEHLGVVHQAHVDLKHISDAMLSNKKIFPRGDPRIVLFIDDLDRCPPKKVVETLEAVQLLVNTNLFVVVLAIDTQYVTLCLEDHYKGVLHPKQQPSGLDYIEKIIQIPYRVPPIGNEHMKSYLQDQMNAKKKETRGPSKKEEESSKRARPNDDNQSPGQPNEKTPLLPGYINVDEEAPAKPAVVIPTEELDFTWEELEMLEDACVLSCVGPRAGKRLVNVFKLMKVIWYRRDQDQTPVVDTPFELRNACVLILALCASNSKRVRLGMCKVLAKLEQTRSMPVGCDNLKVFIERTLEEGGAGQATNNLLTMIHDEKCSRILEKVVWGEDEEKWNLTRKDLRLSRSFSFVGEYSEPVDGNGIHHPSIDTRN